MILLLHLHSFSPSLSHFRGHCLSPQYCHLSFLTRIFEDEHMMTIHAGRSMTFPFMKHALNGIYHAWVLVMRASNEKIGNALTVFLHQIVTNDRITRIWLYFGR